MIAVVGKTRAHSAFRNSTLIRAITMPSMRPSASHLPSASPICRFVLAGVHLCSGSLTSRSDGHRRRLPRPVRSPCPGVSSVSGASTYSAAHGLNRISTVLATPSLSVPFHLQPRRVRSRSRVSQTGRFAMFPAVSFLFAVFRIWGYEPWLIFPVQS